jgi:glycosyltransferase involved in cell wall biosynthesis
LKFAKFLSQNNFEVFVLTVDPEKASYPVTDLTLSKEISNDLKVFHSDSFEPLNILGLFMSKKNIPYGGFANTKESFSQKALRFIRGNFFIPDARIGWVNKAFKKASEIIAKYNIDCILISSPPHSSQLIGLKLKKKNPEIKWIADLRDPWTDIYYYNDLLHTLPAKKLDSSYEKKVLINSDAVLVVSPSIKRTFLTKSNEIVQEKIHVIPNGYDESDFLSDVNSPTMDQFRITYVGTMADSYDPELFFKILKEIINEQPDLNLKLRLVGSISSGIKSQIEQNGLGNETEFISYVPHEVAVNEMRSSNLLLLIIPNVNGSEGILTGKLFEYIGAQKPILGIGPPEGDASTILKDSNSGEMFSRKDPVNIKAYILQMIKDWRDLKINTYHSSDKYSRRKQAEAVGQIINNL